MNNFPTQTTTQNQIMQSNQQPFSTNVNLGGFTSNSPAGFNSVGVTGSNCSIPTLTTTQISALTTTQIPSINTSINSIWSSMPSIQMAPVIHPAKGNIMVSDGKGGYTSMEPLDFFLTWLKKESKTEQARVAMAEVLEKFSDLLVTLKISRSDPGMEEDD